jgi:hypothetical protein
MTTVFEKVEAALGAIAPSIPFAYDEYLTANGEDLPDEFLVYFEVHDAGLQHADNVETLRSYRMQISYYSRNGAPSFAIVDAAMFAAGFSKGPGGKLPRDPNTRHFGLYREYTILE